ncbi:MAG: hypothetical protein H6742_02555 [Alphaproteobacteria bacterium]|nr:hypothetical protein [Alphaproteobacteria bacterium]
MRAEPGSRGPLWAWILAGAALRLLRVVTRWDELTLAYAAYDEPVARALGEGRLLDALGTWIGLHPPLYALMHGTLELVAPVPLLFLLLSALLSLSAVALVGRLGGPLAAAVLATSPLQLADAAEVNNYPLASLAIAVLLLSARGPWWRLCLAAALACFSHVLGAAAAGAVVLWRLVAGGDRRGVRLRLACGALLAALPVVVGAAARAGGGEAFIQPELDPVDWALRTAQATGPVGAVVAVALLFGLRGPALAAWLGVAGVLAVSLISGAAAPHQRPYLDLLGPPAAVAVGWAVQRIPAALPRRAVAVAIGLLCLARGGDAAWTELERIERIRLDLGRQRALDVALAESAPGDTLWVVVPALEPDDDKSAIGPLMWRLPPWAPMPIARPVPFEYVDYRYGQPRGFRGRVVHTSTELDEQAFDHVASAVLPPAGEGRVFVVLADHGPATGLIDRVERALRPYRLDARVVGDDVGLGADRLYLLTGLLENAP